VPRHALVLRGRENIGVKTDVVERSECAWQGQEGGRCSQMRRGRDRHREREDGYGRDGCRVRVSSLLYISDELKWVSGLDLD
jgi:hypothetical protein